MGHERLTEAARQEKADYYSVDTSPLAQKQSSHIFVDIHLGLVPKGLSNLDLLCM